MKLTTDRHETSRGLFATAELLVTLKGHDGVNRSECYAPMPTGNDTRRSLHRPPLRTLPMSNAAIDTNPQVERLLYVEFTRLQTLPHGRAVLVGLCDSNADACSTNIREPGRCLRPDYLYLTRWRVRRCLHRSAASQVSSASVFLMAARKHRRRS